jgi:N-acetyl-anhydromuramyl-L-alanine amidase AmpD
MATNLLGIGSTGETVKDWQAFLVLHALGGPDGKTLTLDGQYGKNTAFATSKYQALSGLPVTGSLDGLTFAFAQSHGFICPDLEDITRPDLRVTYPKIQARYFTPAQRKFIDWIVIHTMEAPKTIGRARQVANWFASENSPSASPHYCVDNAEVIQCVADHDVAWHAPGANSTGIGIEHAGYASQTDADWQDAYNTAMLSGSAKLVAGLCRTYSIPAVWLSPDDLIHHKRGICGHVDVTMALDGGKGHTDPGAHFPKDRFIALVRSFLPAKSADPTDPTDPTNSTDPTSNA